MRATRFVGIVLALCGAVSAVLAQDAARKTVVVATVDRTDITEADVELQLLLNREVSGGTVDRQQVIEDLIDRELIRGYLKQQGIRASEEQIDLQWARLVEAAQRQQVDLAAELQRIGYPEKSLRQALALPLAWSAHIRKRTTSEQLRERFQQDRRQFDGTTRRVRHLVLTVAPAAEPGDWAKAEEQAASIRKSIAAGETSFADAARRHSQSPSREQGGDLGFIHARGDLPDEVAAAAFKVELNEVSAPVRSPYGVHLVLAEEERPGDLSLEDARPELLEVIAQEAWKSTAAELRKKARIARP